MEKINCNTKTFTSFLKYKEKHLSINYVYKNSKYIASMLFNNIIINTEFTQDEWFNFCYKASLIYTDKNGHSNYSDILRLNLKLRDDLDLNKDAIELILEVI